MHTAYDITINGTSAKTSVLAGKYWYVPCGGVLAGSYSYSQLVDPTGEVKRSRLDGSHKNPLSKANRWRSPSSYYGSRWKQTVYSHTGSCYHTWASLPAGCLLRNVTNGIYKDYAFRVCNITTPSSAATSLSRRAIQNALRKFRRNSHDEQLDLPVAFAERTKTADMVVDAVTRMVRSILLLGERKYSAAWYVLVGDRPNVAGIRTLGQAARRAAERANSIGDKWLAYRYGWTPLLGDIYGACEQIAQMDEGTYSRYRIKAQSTVKTKTTTKTSANANFAAGTKIILATVESVQTTEAGAKVVLYAYKSSPGYVALRDVGVGDPLSTAWELLPYSFVVDWFLGVGNFLEAVSALQGYTFVAGTITTFENRDDQYIGRLRKTDGAYSLSWSTLDGLCRREQLNVFNRQVLTETDLSFQSVIGNWEFPGFKRMADAFALLGGAFTRAKS